MSEKVSQLQEVFPCMSISCIQEKLILVDNIEAASKLLLLEQEAKFHNASKVTLVFPFIQIRLLSVL